MQVTLLKIIITNSQKTNYKIKIQIKSIKSINNRKVV